jgi:GNAT superfamily N-acetyltransferase
MNFEDMYKDYVMSDIGAEVIVDPDLGYVQFRIQDDRFCVISVYLKPEHRGKEITPGSPFMQLQDKALAVAKERGCKLQIHNLNQETKVKDRLLKYVMSYGMKLSHNEGQYIVFYKEI